MISRIYVIPTVADSRAKGFQKSFNNLEISGRVQDVALFGSYTINANFNNEELSKIGNALTNSVIEKFSINTFEVDKKYNYVIEIGFMPGVTDNVARSTKEMVTDLLHRDFEDREDVYTSKVFLLSGKLNKSDLEKISFSLHNPLIERASVLSVSDLKKNGGLPRTIPEVILVQSAPVLNVSLSVSDEILSKIGKEGIVDENGIARGPLALDLTSMKVIAEHFAKLGRNPTDIELESLAQTWSEHCKHTIFANPIDEIKDGLYKTYIKGATNQIRKQKGNTDFCLSVFSDNAGGIVFDDDFLITHKVETHNSPSALDPFGGAVTGIVGVNRDTIGFGLGAKPVANAYGFCFGYPDDTRPLYRDSKKEQKMLPPKRIMDGVIKGVNFGGNTSGIPTVSGFVRFDDRFRGKPLVFVGTVGLMPRELGTRSNKKLSYEKGAQPGDYIVVTGGRVGADGIHGATFSSVAMDSKSPATAVQIGDPITQKKMSDAIVKEARDMDLYTSITDNGAGGISCSIAEMAKECGGAIVDIDKVPLKYPGLLPWQIWISESQERMTLSVPKEKWNLFKRLMDSRGVEATVVGEFTDSGNCIVKNNGKTIMNMSLEFLHDGLPKRNLKTLTVAHLHKNPISPKGNNRTKQLLELLKNGNVGGFNWISEQYDHEVQASSVIKPLSGRGKINTDAQVFNPILSSKKGVVVSTGVYPSYSDISTYAMAAGAIDTAVRNSIASGGKMSHLAILDNFCWCSSYNEERLGELVSAVKACYDVAVSYGTPFISGKDSMFNDFRGYDEKGKNIHISIPPTLLISAIGVVPDIRKTITPEFKMAGDSIYLVGDTNDELGAGEYYKMLARQQKSNDIGNDVPVVDLEKNKKTYLALENVIEKELLASSISLTSGGLVVALAKASVGGGLGFAVSLKNIYGTAKTVDAQLFSESQGRILVTVAKKNEKAFEKIMKDIAHTKIGTVSKGNVCVIKDAKGKKVVDTNIKKLSESYHYFSNTFK